MATYFSVVFWRTPWTEEPGGLQFMESQRVGHDWATNNFQQGLRACRQLRWDLNPARLSIQRDFKSPSTTSYHSSLADELEPTCVASIQLDRLSPVWPWDIYVDSLCLSFLLLNCSQCFLPWRVVNENLKLRCECLSQSKHLLNISYSISNRRSFSMSRMLLSRHKHHRSYILGFDSDRN